MGLVMSEVRGSEGFSLIFQFLDLLDDGEVLQDGRVRGRRRAGECGITR